MRQRLVAGEVEVPRVGVVCEGESGSLPFLVRDGAGMEVRPVSQFLTDLMLSDMSAGTCRSYAHDLLRWFRLLWLLEIGWERATRDEATVMVAWLRTARNPQRAARGPGGRPGRPGPGEVNVQTGKPRLSEGYAPATINHALTVVSGYYGFHGHFGRGPVLNPVPEGADRRRMLAHHNPLEPWPSHRRAPLRQKTTRREPRSIPDRLWDALFAAVTNDRDRALLAFYVSSGARASELLGLVLSRVDWAGQRIWVVSKGSRILEPVPASPEAFVFLARYLDQHGRPGEDGPVWRTLRGESRPLSYSAVRRMLQRANDKLGTNWTLHDCRHTAAARMAADPTLTLVEIQTVMRHRQLSTTQRYLVPRVEDMLDKLHAHYTRPKVERHFAFGYDPDDLAAVFGGAMPSDAVAGGAVSGE